MDRSLFRREIFLLIILVFTLSTAYSIFFSGDSVNNEQINHDKVSIPIFRTTRDNISRESVKDFPLLTLQSFQEPKILFIVGNPTNLDPNYDIPYLLPLYGLDYSVTIHDDDDSYEYNNFDAIVISRTINDPNTVTSLINAPVPILTMEARNFDEFNLGSGRTSDSSLNSTIILNTTHFVTQDFTLGLKTIYTAAAARRDFLCGYSSGGQVHEIISLAGDNSSTDNRALVVLDRGRKGWDGVPAPERRAFWGLVEGNLLNANGWTLWNRTLHWILYEDSPGNATINVDIFDMDNKEIPNGTVSLINSNNISQSWVHYNVEGTTTFNNVPYGLYNLSVEYKTAINDSLKLIPIVVERAYETDAEINFSIKVPIYIDETPPIIKEIFFNNENLSFSAKIDDESQLTIVKLNLTIIRTIDDIIIHSKNYTMVTIDENNYFNDTALSEFNPDQKEIRFNIIATDVASNTEVTEIQSFLWGDCTGPLVCEYGVDDYSNGSLQFYANITDSESTIKDPVILKINKTLVEMHLNDSGFWVYQTQAPFGVTLNYSIYSATDIIGNPAKPSDPNFQMISPLDNYEPHMFDIKESFHSHDKGYVEISVKIHDWSDYQSGVDPSTVEIVYTLNGAEYVDSLDTIEHDLFLYTKTFNYNDRITFYLQAKDFAGNPAKTSTYGPFIINDSSEPVIHQAGIDRINTTSITIWANISDWGSGVTDVLLNYEFKPFEEAGNGAKANKYTSILMEFNGSLYVKTLSFSESGILNWFIEVNDVSSSHTSSSSELSVLLEEKDPFSNFPQLLMTILGTISVIALLISSSIAYQRKNKTRKRKNETYNERLSLISNIYTILVTTEAGIPIYNVTNAMYQKDDILNTTLSGLSVGIDNFLESFQSDFVGQVLSQNWIANAKEHIRISVIEQNRIQVLICASRSYRIFVFLRKKPDNFAKELFYNTIKNLEEQLVISNLGKFDEAVVGPQAQSIIQNDFPITLLKPFTIDIHKLKELDFEFKKGTRKVPISKKGMNVIKCLISIKINSGLKPKYLKPNKLVFEDAFEKGLEKGVGKLLYDETLKILTNLQKTHLEQIFEALWVGSSPKTKILIPC